MQPVLKISPSWIVEHKQKSWLCANISIGDKKITPYFEVENKFAPYLCTERADPFFILALSCATINGFDMECEAPVTDTLYFNIANYLVPTISKFDQGRKNIQILAPTAPPLENAGAVATSFSGGIDSWYSVLKNLDHPAQKFRVSHLLMHNGGVQPIFDQKKAMLDEVARALGLEAIYIRCNYFPLMQPLVTSTCDAIEYLAYPFALQKLLHIFNMGTGVPLDAPFR